MTSVLASRRVRCAAVFAAAVVCTVSFAGEITVSNASDIDAAMSTAQPGDVLVMEDGVWTNQLIRLRGDGAPGNPITLRAQTPGGAVLNGTSRIEIGGDWIVVEGLRFEGGALSSGHVIRFQSSGVDANHSVLRDTAIIDYNPPSIDTRYFWVSLFGTYNTVEHCRFENQNHSGVTVCVWGDWPNNHIIRNNHFVDRPEGPENGWETIRVGTSDYVDESSETVVESNLFQRTDGEIEAVSNKTGNNVYRYNTFRETSATITLRHGFNATVEGNFFFGEGASGSGGVRVIGPGHRIYNNYFEGLRGRTEGIIALEAGEPNAANSGYLPVDDVVVAHNTFVDCNDPAFALARSLSSDRSVLPTNVTIVGNLISSPNEPVATNSNANVTWQQNVAYADGLGTASGGGVAMLGSDPLSPNTDGFQRPAASGSPAEGVVTLTSSLVAVDIEGDTRGAPADAGADEITTSTPMRGPLFPEDVGPTWWNATDPGGPDADEGALIEAENADQILDPDNDGDVFTTLEVAGASAGAVLVAPAGGRTDLTNGPQETVAVYTVTFPASGMYTAYYRARGFNGSSDSFFTPTGFATDPDLAETVSDDGAFRWETGDTFTVPSGMTQMEFRISRREADTQIDAVVFHPTTGLSDSDLDAIALDLQPSPCYADFDGNGQLDIFDSIAYLRLYDAGDPAANVDPGSGLNVFDVVRHIILLQAGCP